MLRFNGKDEQFTKGAEVGVDDERENGDKSIIRTYSPRSPRSPTPGSYIKKSSPPMSTPTRNRRHSFISPDEKPPKGMNYAMPLPPTKVPPTKVVTPADAAAVLAYINNDKKLNYHQHSNKYTVDEKPLKKQLKRSASFNHSNRPISPRQTATNPYIDVGELLATTVSFVRENNKKLDRLSDEVRSDGQSSDNDMDSIMSDDSTDSWQQSSNREFENEIEALGSQLNDMEQRYKEQIRGKNKLIERLESSWKKSEKDLKRRRQEKERIERENERLERELEASKMAIAELAEQQHAARELSSPDPEQVENIRLLELELEEKDKIIEELNKKVQISNQKATEISNQLLKYQSLENEWKNKQMMLDSLTIQLEVLKKRDAELIEKDSLIETLNIRLDTSQKVIAELRDKHAPHDLLRQIRQKDYIIDNLTQKVENIDADMKDKDDDISELNARLTEEKKHVEKLKEQTAQIEPLKKRLEEAEDANYDTRSQLAHKERQLAEFEKRHKEASQISQDSQDKIRAQEQNITALRQEITQIRQTLSGHVSEVREKDRLIMTLGDESARMRSNYQGLINALSEKDLKIQQIERHLESLQNAPKNDSSSESETKVGKNEVRLNALQKVLNNKIEECRVYEKKIANLEKEFDVFKKQIEETQSASSEKEVKIARLVKMNRQLKEEITELKQKLEEKDKELELVKAKIPKPSPEKAASSSSSASSYTSRRISDSPRVTALKRTTSTPSSPVNRSRRITDSPRVVALSRTTSTPSSPINRSAVTQRKREMEVVNHMLSGVASKPTVKSTVKTAAKPIRPKENKSTADTKASTSTTKQRTSLIRPLSSKKESPTKKTLSNKS